MFKHWGAVSLLALGLVSGTVLTGAQVLAQEQTQEQPAGEVQVPQEVLDILNDTRPLSELSVKELRNRARNARALAKQQGLPDEIRAQLQDIAKAARAELDAREAEAPKTEEPPAAENPAEQPPQPPAEQPAEQQAPPPVEQPVQLPETPPAPETQPEQPAVQEPVQEQAPAAEQPAPEQPAPEQPAPEQPAAEQPVPEQPAAEQPAAKPAEPAPVIDKKEVQELDANAGLPEAEKKARQFLTDGVDVSILSDDDLKARLDAMRDLMAENALSQKTERALRKKLQADRRILRQRIAAQRAAEEEALAKKAAEAAAAEDAKKQAQQSGQSGPTTTKKTNIVIVPQITINTPVIEILRDRRRSDELTDEELRRRVNVFRDAEADPDYVDDFDEQDRLFWRESLRRDRETLRRRMAEERRQREEELAMYDDENSFDIEDDYQPGRKVPRNVFEAEADDEELQEILISPPKKKLRQRYTIKDIEDNEELRDSMPRIEIDTIRFGFNEAFVREEEVENLDRIAAIIEKVLRQRPREVFLIEGHTDAVGSDAYNLKLSRARAEAVKKALTTYYVISPRNLQTVGLGERYLKIPTAEPEAENRRVSLSRATPLVGELDQSEE